MSISHMEYLLFSGLSYCYFQKSDIGKDLGEILGFQGDYKERHKRILIKNDYFKTFNYFKTWTILAEKVLPNISDWEVIDILDRTDFGDEETKTGYYSIAFGKRDYNGGYEDIILAFRGSQMFPLKEAYRDFIETDLKIGFGKKPIQFDEGLEAYERLIKEYDYKKVKLTGHSLGGGIAQYVAVMSERILEDKSFVPTTITFNGVGILVEGMIKVEEFLELKKTKEFILKMVPEVKWEKIKNTLIFYLKKKAPFIKSSTRLLPIPDDFGPQKLKLWDIEKVAAMSQLKLIHSLPLEEKQFDLLIDTLFDKKHLNEELAEAMSILNNFHENKKYLNKVLNFAHTNDFTASYFFHIGKTIFVNRNFEVQVKTIKRDFLKTLMIFQTVVKQYHLFDVFIPFIGRKDGMNIFTQENYFSPELNIKYVASALRRMIFKELCSRELLLIYYKRKDKFNTKEIEALKNLIANDFEKNKETFIFSEQLKNRILNLEKHDFLSMWFDTLERLSSPYEYQDIFDYINYVFTENAL